MLGVPLSQQENVAKVAIPLPPGKTAIQWGHNHNSGQDNTGENKEIAEIALRLLSGEVKFSYRAIIIQIDAPT